MPAYDDEVNLDATRLLDPEVRDVPFTGFAMQRKYLGYVYSLLSATLPEFLPVELDWEQGCLPFLGLLPILFYIEVLLVIVMHVAPFSKSQADLWGTSGTVGQALWFGKFSFIGVITTGFCLATWSFGYISPEWWAHQSPLRASLYGGHLFAAIVRSATCLLFILLLAYRGWLLLLWPQYSWIFVWSIGMLLISFIHLAVAALRFRSWSTDDRPIFRRSQRAALGAEYDAATGLKIKLDPPLRRKIRQIESQARIAQKTHATPAKAVWHHPRNAIVTEDSSFHNKIGPLWWFKLSRLFTRLVGGAVPELAEDYSQNSLFSRCYCCLDTLPKARPLDTPFWLNFQHSEWTFLRHGFLRIPLHSHSSDESEPQYPAQLPGGAVSLEERLQLNHLCPKCDAICGRSTLLDLMGGFTLRRFAKFLWHALSPFPLTDELFEHWSTFPQLLAEAQKGCHLCSLILDTLSSDQQSELCRRDARLERQLIELEDITESRKQAIKVGRTVYVKILTPVVSNRGWRPDSNRRYAESSLLLMPHFGYARVPRRWIRQRNVERAHSLNMDPGMKWHLEHVDPIEIRRTELQSRGAICLKTDRSTASDASLDHFIHPWLRKHRHEDRQDLGGTQADESQSLRMLPSRLIDLMPWDDSSQSVHVVGQSHYANGKIRYAALSYCWRQSETNTLTKQSVDQAEIHVSKLAPTIQDAISVTKGLGVRYLWVDALCIQQDSKNDFDAELQKMSDIYSNADFVISAVAAVDSSESFIVDRSPLAVNPCLVGVQHFMAEMGSKPGCFGGVFALPSRKYASWALDDIKFSRLASRGWVFQEEHLARRTLSFTEHQVILQCNVCGMRVKQLDWENVVHWSQSLYYELVRPDILLTCYKFLGTLFWHCVIRPGSTAGLWSLGEPLEIRQDTEQVIDLDFTASLRNRPNRLQTKIWFDLVEQYTLRFLSQNSDRLSAIQGLAMRLEQALIGNRSGHSYCQGIFDSRDSLIPSLLWYVSDARTARPPFRAPSWSWASVDGSIKNNSTLASAEPKKCDINVLKGPLQTGYTVQLFGKLRLATWRQLGPDETQDYYLGHQHSLTLDDARYHQQFIPVSTDPTSGPEANPLCDSSGRQIGYLVRDTDEDLPNSAIDSDGNLTPSNLSSIRQLFCLQIIVRPQNDRAEQDFSIPWATRGLALIRSKSDEDLYRRVGYIELSRDHPGMEFFSSSPDKGRNRRERPYPVVDPHGFFQNCEARTIEIM